MEYVIGGGVVILVLLLLRTANRRPRVMAFGGRGPMFVPHFDEPENGWTAAPVMVGSSDGRSIHSVGLLKRVTVMEYERALVYVRGRFDRVLEPGRHWLFGLGRRFVRLDVRPRYVSITGQEVLTADGVTLRLSIAAQFEIIDLATAVNAVQDYGHALYLALQLALREIVGSAPIDELLEDRGAVGRQLMEKASSAAGEIGLNLIGADLKDIMFPGDLKRLFAQVVQARKEGQAALERARGETAALRSLANAARMVSDNPALMQLRLMQQVGESKGNTFVIGVPGSGTPLPVAKSADEPSRALEPGADEDQPES